jgi:hypothetical protein
MTTLARRQPRVVLYEGSGAEPLPAPERAELVAALLDRGYSVTLAHEGAAGSTAGGDSDGAAFVVVGRFAGAAPAVSAGGSATVEVHDCSGRSTAEVVGLVDRARRDLPLRESHLLGDERFDVADDALHQRDDFRTVRNRFLGSGAREVDRHAQSFRARATR